MSETKKNPTNKKTSSSKKKRDYTYILKPGIRKKTISNAYSQFCKDALHLKMRTNSKVLIFIAPENNKALFFTTHPNMLSTIDASITSNKYRRLRGDVKLLEWIQKLKKPINIMPLFEESDKFDDEINELPPLQNGRPLNTKNKKVHFKDEDNEENDGDIIEEDVPVSSSDSE